MLRKKKKKKPEQEESNHFQITATAQYGAGTEAQGETGHVRDPVESYLACEEAHRTIHHKEERQSLGTNPEMAQTTGLGGRTLK